MATVQNIIDDFELFMDDTTELSTAEEIRVLEKASQHVANQLPWEWLRNEYTGTASGTTLALPTGFTYIVENANYTENGEYGNAPVVYIGTDYTPWRVVSLSDRRSYRNKSGYVWVDIVNSNLVFSADPGSKSVEYDYIKKPTTLTAVSDTVWVPDEFAPILFHSMCIDDFVIQQSEKARSYRDEHLSSYNMYMRDMRARNFRLNQLT